MRVALDLISETGLPGGIRTYWVELVERLARAHPQDRYTLFGAADLELPAALLEHDNVELHVVGRSCRSRTRRRLRQQLTLPPHLGAGEYDCVHSINNVAPLTTPLPRVVTIHDLTVRHVPERFSLAKRLLLGTLVPASARAATRVIASSWATRGDVLDATPGLDPGKIHVVHLGLDDRFGAVPSPEALAEVRARYRLPERFSFFIGALEPGKNLDGLLAAQRRLRDRGAEVPPLVIAGGGGWGGVPEMLAAESELPVQPIGRVPDDDLPLLYHAAEVFVFPSLWEGFGLPVLEAFACGTPVLTSNRSSLPEVAGNAAALVDPENVDAIAGAWHALWSDAELRQRLRRLGRERARCFSWERVAAETRAVYAEVVGAPEPASRRRTPVAGL